MIPFYSLEGYRDFFYGQMVPSAGYIKYFELRKYRRGVLLRFPQLSSPDKIPEYVDEKMLYRTFGEQNRWGKLMGITYVSDLNRKIQEGKFGELIQLSEALHERRVVEIADMITKPEEEDKSCKPGPSSSGKNHLRTAAVHTAEGQRTGASLHEHRRLLRREKGYSSR